MIDRRLALGVLLAFFALYLFTVPPTLTPYRDTGEFALSARSLGVSHPPSYPAYVILGRLADIFPLGNPAYRLTLLSAMAGAGALALLFLAASSFGPWAALAGVALLGTNVAFWTVCGVQEMYSLHMLFAAALLLLGLKLRMRFSARVWCGAAFLFGFFLGNRTDLLLWTPGLAVLGLPDLRRRRPGEIAVLLAQTAGFALLGLTVYLYLPVRSAQGPWLDWNHPATLTNFIGSITRKGYGGTLDLLSKNYAAGAMFLPNLKVYWAHLWKSFSLVGLSAALLGAARSACSDRKRFAGMALLYAASGPLFLFLANMPTNPHAMAIVEPHYLLSDIVLAFWVAEGAAAARELSNLRWAAAALAAAALAQPWILGRLGEMDRRWNLFAHDYAGNVLRSAPPGSTVVAKEDVQLFSLWYAQRVEGRRPDVRVTAQGLAHSPWYRASHRRESSPLILEPRRLKSPDVWKRFIAANAPAYATMDTELFPGLPLGPPVGMLVSFQPKAGPSELPWEFMIRRGDYRYERRPDFFTSDLINDYANARQRLGGTYLESGDAAAARHNLVAAWSMKRLFPEAATFLAFLHLNEKDYAGARRVYEAADSLFAEKLELTREYHSLPEVRESVANAMAEARINLGVVHEKLKDKAAAERSYRGALALNPQAAKAHYNIAVLHWKEDWEIAVRELEAALRVQPDYPDGKKFLAAARAHLAAERAR